MPLTQTEDSAGVGHVMAALGMSRIDTGVADLYGVSCEFWQYSRNPSDGLDSETVDQTASDYCFRAANGFFRCW